MKRKIKYRIIVALPLALAIAVGCGDRPQSVGSPVGLANEAGDDVIDSSAANVDGSGDRLDSSASSDAADSAGECLASGTLCDGMVACCGSSKCDYPAVPPDAEKGVKRCCSPQGGLCTDVQDCCNDGTGPNSCYVAAGGVKRCYVMTGIK